MNRTERKKSKLKRKRILNFFLLFILIVGAGIIYFFFQYNSGASLAGKDDNLVNKSEDFEDFEEVEPELGVVNVLLLGSDARGDEEDARSDSLMIAHYNQDTKKVKLVSIMRDTFVIIPGYGPNKINAAFSLGGPELVRKTIKDNFDVDVNYYSIVDFTGFPKIIDIIAPSGIEVDIKSAMSHGIDMTLYPGLQTLHGDELLGYVRYRNDSESDFGRVGRQQEVLSKIKDEAISLHSIVNLPKTLGLVNQFIDTNVDNKTILTIGKGLITGNSKGMETMRIPVEGSFEDKRVQGSGLVLSINLEKNKGALQDFLSTSEPEESTP